MWQSLWGCHVEGPIALGPVLFSDHLPMLRLTVDTQVSCRGSTSTSGCHCPRIQNSDLDISGPLVVADHLGLAMPTCKANGAGENRYAVLTSLGRSGHSGHSGRSGRSLQTVCHWLRRIYPILRHRDMHMIRRHPDILTVRLRIPQILQYY